MKTKCSCHRLRLPSHVDALALIFFCSLFLLLYYYYFQYNHFFSLQLLLFSALWLVFFSFCLAWAHAVVGFCVRVSHIWALVDSPIRHIVLLLAGPVCAQHISPFNWAVCVHCACLAFRLHTNCQHCHRRRRCQARHDNDDFKLMCRASYRIDCVVFAWPIQILHNLQLPLMDDQCCE